jgi:hypothetical protein
MRTKTFKCGKTPCKTYIKPVGKGWETGFVFNHSPVFVGNFIHSAEATRWYKMMNNEITRFGRRYTAGHKFPTPWLKNFVTNHLYKTYYTFLDGIFTQYNRSYGNAVRREVHRFNRTKGRYTTPNKTPMLKAA